MILNIPEDIQSYSSYAMLKYYKVSKGAKIRNRYNQVPHLTQDTNGKVTNSQLDTTNENQEVSPFPAGDYKAHINRRAQRPVKYFTGGLKPVQLQYIKMKFNHLFRLISDNFRLKLPKCLKKVPWFLADVHKDG